MSPPQEPDHQDILQTQQSLGTDFFLLLGPLRDLFPALWLVVAPVRVTGNHILGQGQQWLGRIQGEHLLDELFHYPVTFFFCLFVLGPHQWLLG